MVELLPLRLQSAVLSATNQFFDQSGVQASPERCKTGLLQGISITVDKGSSLQALGNLESVQKAQVQFQCAPRLTAEQRAGLRETIVAAIADVLDNDLPATTRKPTTGQLRQVVQLTVDKRFDKCTQSVQRDVAVTPGARFTGSVIKAGGCLEDEFAQIVAGCEQEIEDGIYQGPQCGSLLDCVKSDGSIILLSNNINLGGDCPQLSEISENVMAALRRLNDSPGSNGSTTGEKDPRNNGSTADGKPKSLSTGSIVGIVVGSMLLLLVIVIVAVVAAGRRRNSTAQRRLTFNANQPTTTLL